MARVFKPTYPKRKMVNGKRVTVTRDGKTVYEKQTKWYVQYRDAQDKLVLVPGYTDKRATEQMAAKLEREAELERSGVVDQYAKHRKRSLTEHVDEWHQSLLDKDTTQKQANYHA